MKKRTRTLTVGGPPPGTREPPRVVQFAPTEDRRVFRKTYGQLMEEFAPRLLKMGLQFSEEELRQAITCPQISDGPIASIVHPWVMDELRKGVEFVDDQPASPAHEVCEAYREAFRDCPLPESDSASIWSLPKNLREAFKQISEEEYEKIDQELDELLPDHLFEEPLPTSDLTIGQVFLAFQEVFPAEKFKWLSVTVDRKRAILTICSDKMTRTYLFDKSRSLKELFENVPHVPQID